MATYNELCEKQFLALQLAMTMLRKIDREQQVDDREIKTELKELIIKIDSLLNNDLFKIEERI